MRKDVNGFCVNKVLDSDTINHRDFIDDFGKQCILMCDGQVKINTMDHSCGSTRLNEKDIKHATSKCVAEKVRSWLIEDATVRPKELKERVMTNTRSWSAPKGCITGRRLLCAHSRVIGKRVLTNCTILRLRLIDLAQPAYLLVITMKLQELSDFKRLFIISLH